jgi:hypothetical protein
LRRKNHLRPFKDSKRVDPYLLQALSAVSQVLSAILFHFMSEI